MKILLASEDSIRLENSGGALTVEAPTAEQSYSPFHMLGSGLAMCTWSILESWADNKSLSTDGLAIDVSWEFVESPKRIGSIRLGITWPGLPAERKEQALRVAALCPIHKTFEHPPAVAIEHRT